MVGKKSVTTVLVLMCTVLIGVFSLSIFQSIMNLRDKPAAAGEFYLSNGAVSIGSDQYNNYSTFIIGPTKVEDQAGAGSVKAIEGFKNFVTSVNNGVTFEGKTVKLTYNVDMGDAEIMPIGAHGDHEKKKYEGCTIFKGTFDGNAHTIKNLVIKVEDATLFSSDPKVGLFASLGGTVINLRLENVRTYNYWATGKSFYIGTLVGLMNSNSLVENCIVDNCQFRSRDDSAGNGVYVGGLVGAITGTNINVRNCIVNNFNVYGEYNGGGAGNAATSYGTQIGPSTKIGDASINVTYCEIRNNISWNVVNTNGYCSYANICAAANDLSSLEGRVSSDGGVSGSAWYYLSTYNDGWPMLRSFVSGWTTYSFSERNNPTYGSISGPTSVVVPNTASVPQIQGASVFVAEGCSGEIRVSAVAVYPEHTTITWSSSGVNYVVDFTVPFYNITFSCVDNSSFCPEASCNNCTHRIVKPKIYDGNGSLIKDSDESNNIVYSLPINTVINVTDDRSGYSDTSGGDVVVYNFNMNGVTYYVKYHFESAVPGLTVSASGYTVTDNNVLEPTFGGGYVDVTFKVVDNATMTNSSNKTLTADQKYRVAKSSTVTAVYDQENFTWVTYTIGEETLKYTCADTYLLSSTGLGNGFDKSKNINSNTTIKPTIITKNEMVILTFNPVIVSDTVGNKIINTPTITGSGWSGSATAGYTLSLFPDSKIVVEEISLLIGLNLQEGYGFTIKDTTRNKSYSIKFLTNSNDLYSLTSYEYSDGIETTLSDILVQNQKTIKSTASVTVVADYANVSTISFNISTNAYLYAPIGEQVYDSNNYASANFGSEYINNTGAEFKNFLNYKKSTYSIKIASDTANSSKPKLTRTESKTTDMYTITYVASYRLGGVSKNVEVAQYLTKNPACKFTSDGYTEGSAIGYSTTIRPVFVAETFTFKTPSDTSMADLYVNGYRQWMSREYQIGTNLTIGTNSATFATYSNVINVDNAKTQLSYSFGVTRKIMTFAADNVTTALNETEEVVSYKIIDTYLNSAYLEPQYSDTTISQSATQVDVSAGLVIQPIVRTDYIIEFTTITFGDITIRPKVVLTSLGYDMGYSGEVKDTVISYYDSGYTNIDYGNVKVTEDSVQICRPCELGGLSITFEKRVNSEEGKNDYVFTFNIDALMFDTSLSDHYEIVYELVDYPNYAVTTDSIDREGTINIDVDTLINCEIILKSYEIQTK